MNEQDKTARDADKAEDTAAKARVAADTAQAKADEAGKSPEQKKADQAKQDADDAEAAAAEKGRAAKEAQNVSTVAEAKVMAPVDGDTDPGDHRAQKFGNDPSNPKPAPGVDMTANLVKLQRKTPDVPSGLVTTEVPEVMVGDYCRAGWSRA